MARDPLILVSGGQTGVDRGALEAARALGIPIEGNLPRGRMTEAGPLGREEFPELEEGESDDPAVRTLRNVESADATLVLHLGAPPSGQDGWRRFSPGTHRTIASARAAGRPLLVLAVVEPGASERIARWIRAQRPRRINVAGPRESEDPGVQEAARVLLASALGPFGKRLRRGRKGGDC